MYALVVNKLLNYDMDVYYEEIYTPNLCGRKPYAGLRFA